MEIYFHETIQGKKMNTRKYQVQMKKRVAALENLNRDVDVKRVCEPVIDSIRLSDKELKQCKPWFDEC
jgi:hypothetical protein